MTAIIPLSLRDTLPADDDELAITMRGRDARDPYEKPLLTLVEEPDDESEDDADGDDVRLHPCEAVCPVSFMTYNKHLPRSPWVDDDGKQAF